MTQEQEEDFLFGFRRTCFESYYPLGIFSYEKELTHLDFSDITIRCGGNGSGKSTLLNIIAEKLKLSRQTCYNKTYFFDPYLASCYYELNSDDPIKLRDLMTVSRIITSDDVFNYIIDVRRKNENLSFKRDIIFEEKSKMNSFGGNYDESRPRRIDMEDITSIKAFNNYYDKSRKSASRLVREKVGMEERTYSNGENGFKYFTDAIQPGGLYLLDEPENSLSAEMQLELVHFLHGMARFYDCQFILSSHSPFILSLLNAKIYNMDAEPVSTCKWTELPNVRIYHDFFNDYQAEF
ncbi:MAG: AAA family ATPase [Prevotella sp.]|nr:AAA family ATPase [Candidatus Equicola faecalis]